MKSSSQQYFVGLDHIRALAALLVFSWHFIHSSKVDPDFVPSLPFAALFDEGHVGVSIFMVLSGYLFAKLLNNRKIILSRFYLNRLLRLAPLMIVVVLINAIVRHAQMDDATWYFFATLVNGLVFPSLPNGGWSITAEFHFYLLLPLLLWLRYRSAAFLVLALVAAVAGRAWYFYQTGSVSYLSYWTIIGRIDLFIFGILAHSFARPLHTNQWCVPISLILLAFSYWWFDSIGGFTNTGTHVLWVFWPTLEGAIICVLINWYAQLTFSTQSGLSNFFALIGKVSYSIYLLHFFVVFRISQYISTNIVSLENFYVTLGVGVLVFLLLIPFAVLSYRLVEKPFLLFRVRYFQQQT